MIVSPPKITYRVYCYDGAHKIVTAEWIQVASDEEAIGKALAGGLGTKCEIWDGARMVAALDAERRSA